MALRTRRTRILLAEDNPADVRLLKEAFKENGFACDVTVADDGSKALSLMHGALNGDKGSQPDLIILDLNLPKISGLSVLAKIKEDSRLSLTPVFMLSTSKSASDVTAAIKLGAKFYFSKSLDFAGTLLVAREIEDRWRATVDSTESQ
jgi:chemotaxis family two-component system response regulator Rcp1